MLVVFVVVVVGVVFHGKKKKRRRRRKGVRVVRTLQFGGAELKSRSNRWLNLFSVVQSSNPRPLKYWFASYHLGFLTTLCFI